MSFQHAFAQMSSSDNNSSINEQSDMIPVCEFVSYCSNPVYFGSITTDESNNAISSRQNTSLVNSNISNQSVINNTNLVRMSSINDPIENVTWKTHYNEKLGISIDLPSYWIYEEKTNRFNYTISDLRIDQTFSPFEKYMGIFVTLNKDNPDLRHIYEIAKSSLDSYLTSYDSKFDWHLIEGVNTTKYNIDGKQAASYIIQRVDKNTEGWGTGIESIFVKHEFTPINILFFTDANFFDDPYAKSIKEYMIKSIKWLSSNFDSPQNQDINFSNVSNSSSYLTQNSTAVINTTQGPIKIEFYPDVAPNHVKNFQDLASHGFYDGIAFHRIVPGFVIQAGDPNTKYDSRDTWGTGGPGYTINQEFNDIPHERGILSMARTNDPHSAGSQFFIVLNDSKFLDNQYTVFGKVIEGMDTVDKIANLTINSMDQPVNPDMARINTITINK